MFVFNLVTEISILRLFRTHVRPESDLPTTLRIQWWLLRANDGLSEVKVEAEISDLNLVLEGEQNVFRLDVAVDETCGKKKLL